MSRVIRETKRDDISVKKTSAGLILTNRRTGEQRVIDRNSTQGQLFAAKKELQPTVDDPFAGVSARQAVQRMYGTEAEPEPDPEPYVSLTPGILQNKQQRAHDAWQSRQDKAAAEREREENRQEDRRNAERTAELVAERLAQRLAQPEPKRFSELPEVKRKELLSQEREAFMALERAKREGAPPEMLSELQTKVDRVIPDALAEGGDDVQ